MPHPSLRLTQFVSDNFNLTLFQKLGCSQSLITESTITGHTRRFACISAMAMGWTFEFDTCKADICSMILRSVAPKQASPSKCVGPGCTGGCLDVCGMLASLTVSALSHFSAKTGLSFFHLWVNTDFMVTGMTPMDVNPVHRTDPAGH